MPFLRRGSAVLVFSVCATLACSSSSSSDAAKPGDLDATTDAPGDASNPDSSLDVSADSDAPAEAAPIVEDVHPQDATAIVAARPYGLAVPSKYDASKPAPLIVLLHGYGASGEVQAAYLNLLPTADARGFFLAYPDGTLDKSGSRFWNATDACCGDDKTIDDVGYIDAIIDDVSAKYHVDPKRVFLMGHSNGGFMSHRYACERASRVAAIVSLAGAMWNDPTRCTPSQHVAVLQIHGDADRTILYDGGSISGVPYPSAHTTVADWAKMNGCTGALVDTGTSLDLVSDLPGAETKVERYAGCPGTAVELWTVRGGQHVPAVTTDFGTTTLDFFSAHPKP